MSNKAGEDTLAGWSGARKQAWFRTHGRRRRADVVVCGPPGSGKTYLIGALVAGAGVGWSAGNEPRVLTPIEEAADLTCWVYQHIRGQSGSARIESPGVTSIQTETPDEDQALEIGVLELDSNATSNLKSHPLYRELTEAPVLLVLVDARGLDSGWYWQRLPLLARDLARPRGGVARRLGSAGPGSGLGVLETPRESRGFERIVLALTCIDEVLHRWCRDLGSRPLPGGCGTLRQDATPEEMDFFARQIDAERWVRHLLGATVFGQVRSLIGGPSIALSVGFLSSVGWRRPSTSQPEWRPFGVSALLDLLTRGVVRSPFREVSRHSEILFRGLELKWHDSEMRWVAV